MLPDVPLQAAYKWFRIVRILHLIALPAKSNRHPARRIDLPSAKTDLLSTVEVGAGDAP
jgi:hypothetical protein